MKSSVLRQPDVWKEFQAYRRALIDETLAEKCYEDALKCDDITESELLILDSRHRQAAEATDAAFQTLDLALQRQSQNSNN